MNREEILEIFPEADEAQLIALEKVFENGLGELHALRQQKAEMQAELDAYAARHAQVVQEELRAKMTERFDKAVGDREFVHAFVRESVLEDFIALLQAEENAGRGDKELLNELTEDKGCFVKRYQVTMGPVGEVEAEDVNRLSDAEYYAAFRMKGAK